MTENEEAEFNRVMASVVKRSVVWYHEQDFSRMNDDACSELQSLFTEWDEYDPLASVQISVNAMMMANVWHDKRFYGIAGRAARLLCDVETPGKPAGKVALRQLLDELSELLREPKFPGAGKQAG